MQRSFDDNTFVVVDLETTGISQFDRVCEIGMTKIINGEIIDRFESLINPELSITNTRFHGIKNWMVKDAPLFEDIAPMIIEFMKDSVLIAHNAPFDTRFLRYELKRLGSDLCHYALCTLKIGRRLHPEFASHRLDYMLNEYDIINDCPHRAGEDALSEARLFLEMKNELEANGMATIKSLGNWGLPYNHRWCDEINVSDSTGKAALLTRDDLK